MTTQILSAINDANPTTDILGTGSASPVASSAGSLTLSDLTVSTPNLIPTNVSPTSAIGIISLSALSTSLLPLAPTIATPTSPTLRSFSSTPIPTTSTTSTLSSIIPISSTSAPLFESTSSSISPTETENISSTTVVTVISGTTVTSVLPTTFTNSPSADVVSRRTAAIAGATTGFVALFLIALGVVFWYRRHKLRTVLESTGRKREGRGLLDGEEFDDDERNFSNSMQSYHYPTHALNPEGSLTSLNLMKSRTSETGSIFREEVWPPPGFIDPISKQNSQVDLSGIVNNVMGPSSDQPAGSSIGPQEPHQPTDESSLSVISSSSTSSLITPPTPTSSSSFPYPTVAPTSSTISLPPSPPPPLNRSSLNFQPRKPSPLARATMNDPKLWLTRNVRQTASP